MTDILVYTGEDKGFSSGEQKLFYSRRLGGPYYCWYYLSCQNQWKAIRLQPHSRPRALRKAVGRNLPVSLQVWLREHYLA
jgi:hypothetical protein